MSPEITPYITPNVTLISLPATAPHSIIFDILEAPVFRKYSRLWVFSALYLAVPGSAQCPAKV